ncbi:MAG: alpha/beta hydrolase [Gammaproteobacteria bacterium]|nr:alpha/beta hydrolase [Gammaproteobacteria bacterium]
MSDGTRTPELATSFAVMADGYRLPVTMWEADESPEAIILALHGFNDYRNAFSGPAHFFAVNRITTYAYDQRGFGETTQRGLWPAIGVLEADATIMASLLCARHPDLPLFLLGESMGGAVVMNMQRKAPCIKGIVLVGPAVWGWQTMPFWQRIALRLAAHIVPGKTLTGEGLKITPSDNIEMLRALGRDPLVIKATRVDTIYGLTNLMEAALLSSAELATPTLILYGEKDEIIPHDPTCAMLNRLPETAATRFVLYPDGYHMLMRDLQATVVLQDVVSWIHDQSASLPSTLELDAGTSRARLLCKDE